MGFIYAIRKKEMIKYVGQTTEKSVADRWKSHISSSDAYKRYLENPDRYAFKGTCTYLYRAFHKAQRNGEFEIFDIITLLECDDNELDDNETRLIIEYNTLAPHGYNLTTGGGGQFKHCEETKKRISEYVKKYMTDNIDDFRTSEKTFGMLPYASYQDLGTRQQYIINNHPKCSQNIVFSTSKYPSIEEAKLACNNMLIWLKDYEGIYTPPTKSGGPCKGLRKLKQGYQVRKTINGSVYERTFNNKNKSIEENLQDALEYIELLNKKK